MTYRITKKAYVGNDELSRHIAEMEFIVNDIDRRLKELEEDKKRMEKEGR